jgi:hypothetical protein
MTAGHQGLLRNGEWSRRHCRPLIVVRSVLALWLLFLTAALCVHGYWWGLVLLPFVGLDLWLLRDLISQARTHRP